MQAKVSGSKTFSNTGNQAINGVQRNSNANAGGLDANGQPRSLGAVGDRLSGTATINALFQNTAVVGPPTTANSTTYSISGVRQTNAFAAAATP
jgi:hypothetical protein